MFARILEFVPKTEKKEELIKVMKQEILPILKKQTGFLEVLPFIPENTMDKVITISLWTEKKHAEKYEREVFAKVEEILRPFLTAPVRYGHYVLETSVCEHFEKAMAA